MQHHPPPRLSSSPTSSPRIVESPLIRKRSIRPEMSILMDRGVTHGTDFFEDSSGDDSEWGDDNGTRNFSEVEGLGIRNSMSMAEDFEEPRGRSRRNVALNALPPFNQIPAHGSGTSTLLKEPSSPAHGGDTQSARAMSVRRFGSVRVVHNRGSGSGSRNTQRDSMMSNESGHASSIGEPSKGFSELRCGEEVRLGAGFQAHHRRHTAESLRADSILNAHVITMQALESLSPTASLSCAHGHGTLLSQHSFAFGKPKPASFSGHRHIAFPPLQLQHDPDRPAHLSAHFKKTPYPFTTKKEFPRPATSPRQHVHGETHGIGYDDKKGRHILGIVSSDGEYYFRGRLERNEDAQGIIRTRGDDPARQSADGAKELVLWLSLRRNRKGDIVDCLERVVIPSSLTTTSPERVDGKKGKSRSPQNATVDFDDMYFAHQLRAAYKKLARPWPFLLFSARKLRHIQLGSVSVWSGSSASGSRHVGVPPAGGLLAAQDGIDTDIDAQIPFTEKRLMELFRDPGIGKASYTWVHWAREVAASNTNPAPGPAHPQSTTSARRWARSLDTLSHHHGHHYHADTDHSDPPSTSTSSPFHPDPENPAIQDVLATIQFTHSFAPLRILGVLALMLALGILAALLWIFLGESAWAHPETWGGPECVGNGMAAGALALVLFLAWVAGSWRWL
ncbi:hypothetical protein K458DRAFT_475567 [Lentithecium fluviatile CBS 122367]|uniref:Uncharacterized protein n=1 Tax=Lentithecium fluviatile CBS 122367 TaxID=1168545 RepID=A0A6G1JBU9_9PLEO|nr:hypothetical protein K458DRAFT_475567 [Lentithecium fluviatile CBS 122367]